MEDIQINNLFNSRVNLLMGKTTKIVENPKTDRRVLEKIHEILEAKGLKPIDLAKTLNFSPQYGSYLMRGQRKISVNLLLEIADVLGIDSASLLPSKNLRPKTLEEYIRKIIKDKLYRVKQGIIRHFMFWN